MKHEIDLVYTLRFETDLPEPVAIEAINLMLRTLRGNHVAMALGKTITLKNFWPMDIEIDQPK